MVTGEQSKVEYNEAIENIELFNRLIYGAIYISTAFCIFVTLPISFIRYLAYDMEEKSFLLFFPTWFVSKLFGKCEKKKFLNLDFGRFPFDWRTPYGYLVAFIAQYMGVMAFTSIYTQVINFVYESCWIFVIISRDMQKELTEFNENVQIPNKNRENLMKRFDQLVQTFSDAKKCVLLN